MRDKNKILMVVFASVLMLILFLFPGHEARALFIGFLIYPLIPAALLFSNNQRYTKYHLMVNFAIAGVMVTICLFDDTKNYNSYLINYFYPYVPEGTAPTTSFFYTGYLAPRIIITLLFSNAIVALAVFSESICKIAISLRPTKSSKAPDDPYKQNG
jgi:hypothetical protein